MRPDQPQMCVTIWPQILFICFAFWQYEAVLLCNVVWNWEVAAPITIKFHILKLSLFVLYVKLYEAWPTSDVCYYQTALRRATGKYIATESYRSLQQHSFFPLFYDDLRPVFVCQPLFPFFGRGGLSITSFFVQKLAFSWVYMLREVLSDGEGTKAVMIGS